MLVRESTLKSTFYPHIVPLLLKEFGTAVEFLHIFRIEIDLFLLQVYSSKPKEVLFIPDTTIIRLAANIGR